MQVRPKDSFEMRGALVYPQGSIYNQRTAVIFPTQQTALEPNEVIKVHIPLECVKSEAVPLALFRAHRAPAITNYFSYEHPVISA